MLAELLTCFSRSFGLQLTANLFTPASLHISVIRQEKKKKRAGLRRGRGRRVPRVSTLMHLDGLILQF